MKKISYYIIFLVVIGVALVSLWVYQKYFKEEAPNLLLFEVEMGSIQEVIKARGEVTSQKEFDLEFPFSGAIERVFVDEGQWVNFGNPLMKLETIDFELEQRKLEASLTENRASLNKLIAGATEEELNVLKTKVSNAQKSVKDAEFNLKNVQEKAEADLQEDYNSALTTVSRSVNVGKTALLTLTDIQYMYFAPNDQDGIKLADTKAIAVYTLLGAQNAGGWPVGSISVLDGGTFGIVQNTVDNPTYGNIDKALSETSNALQKIKQVLDIVRVTNLTSAEKTNLSTEKNNIDAEIITISSKRQTIAVQKVINANVIAFAEISINEARSILELARSNLDLTEAAARIEDIEIAEAKIKGIESQISITTENIRKSTIYAPSFAKITKVWFEVREIFRPGQTAVSLSTSGYKIQADISELDIGKIKEAGGNDVLIELDAFPGQEFKGKITSVEPGEVIKEGDKYYRVNIFMEKQEITIRSGMSADLVIQTSFKEDVLKIPEFAVYEKEDKEFVKILESGQQEVESLESLLEVEIETGISDGELVEVIKGLDEGQIIVVSAD